MQVAAELVVIHALLQADEDVVELEVELGALLEEDGKLVLHDNRLVYFLVELGFGGVVSDGVQQLVELGRVLLDDLCDLLLLLLDGLVLSKVLGVLGAERLEDLSLLGRVLVNLHELLNGVQVVVHGHPVLHHLFFTLSELFQPPHLLFDRYHSGVAFQLANPCRLGDHGGQLLARLAEELETLLVAIVL